jgi:uroporphyrinogen-III decarboxylase
MNSQERVLTVFAHEAPDHIPMWCGASQEFWAKAKHELSLDDEGLRLRFHDDFRRVNAKYSGPTLKHNSTIFGIERDGMGYGQPLNHPLANASLTQINDYQWPNPANIDVSDIIQQANQFSGRYAILGGDWSPFWHDAIDLLGMETLLIKMYTEPNIVDTVLEHIVDYYTNVNIRIFDIAAKSIDIFFIGNDDASTYIRFT